MSAERVPNGKCRFGRRHRWSTRGASVDGHDVCLCFDCLLVEGTGRKATDPMGALFEAERIASEFFGAPIVQPPRRRKVAR